MRYAKYAVLVSGLLALLTACKKQEQRFELPAAGRGTGAVSVRVKNVQVRTDTEEIRATGVTNAPSTTKVMPLVPGLITSIPVREGDVVKKGQVIARLDQRGFILGVKQARAALGMAKVGLEAAEREYRRFEDLVKVKATAPANFDKVRDGYRTAQAGHQQAQVGLEMAQQALSDSVIRAPYSGVIYKKLASLGDYATAMPPTVLVVMMDLSHLEVMVSLPEAELARVSEGTPVTVTFPSIDRTIEAKVTRVVKVVDPMTNSFTAIVDVPNPDLALEAGLFAKVRITAAEPRRRVVVPRQAVLDEGSGVFSVFTVDGDRGHRRVVRVTEAGRDTMEVINGLSGNETVVLNPTGLLDGDRVKVEGAPAPGSAPPVKAAAAGKPGPVERVAQ